MHKIYKDWHEILSSYIKYLIFFVKGQTKVHPPMFSPFVSAHWNLRQYLNIYIPKTTLYCCFLPSELIRSCNLGQSIGYLKYGEKKSCWPVKLCLKKTKNLTLQKINDNVWMVYSYMSHKSRIKHVQYFFNMKLLFNKLKKIFSMNFHLLSTYDKNSNIIRKSYVNDTKFGFVFVWWRF